MSSIKHLARRLFESRWTASAALAAVLVTLGIGYMVLSTGAVSYFAAIRASNGSVSGNAEVVNDSGASGGTAVKFGASSSSDGGSGGSDGGGGDTTPPPSSPPPGSSGNCPAFPAVPDASCTGVPAGTSLTVHNGDLYVTTNGAVVDSREVNGCIYVQANNVTIKRTRVNGWCWSGAISTGYGEYTGTLIEDVEVNGTAKAGDHDVAGVALIGVNNYTARRVNVHHGGRGFNVGSNVTIEHSYIHDMFGAGDSHNSGIGSNSGLNITIRHNNISCDIGEPGNISSGGGCSGALVMYADTFGDQIGAIGNLLIEQNMFNAGAGSYCLLIYNTRTNGPYTVRNNLFGTRFNSNCGQYGPVDTLRTAGASMTWENNKWHAPGQAKNGQIIPLDSPN